MTTNALFAEIVGESTEHFELGGVKFKAAPVSLLEYGQWLALEAGAGPQGIELDAQAEWIADKLQRRILGAKTRPDTITTDWVLENVTVPRLRLLRHVLLFGELPVEGAGKA